MRITLSTALVALAVLSEASATMMSPRPQHASLARRITRKKRCIARQNSGNNPAVNVASSPSSSSAAPPPPPAPTPDQPQNNGNNNNNNNNNNNGNNNNNNNHSGGITTAPPNECGFGAVPYPTQDSGPNGNIEYLNCGVRGGGWNPPRITLDNVICKPFDEVVNMPGNPFGGCAEYAWMFIAASQETGVPSTLLASIAMQESSCRPYVTGRAGEVGMMQLTGEKCPDGYPNDRCYDAQTNIAIGARYLRREIDRAGGNLLLATGFYNGWFLGLTIDAANGKPSCGERNNLDYLQFVFNGYCQGVDPSSLNMGTFRNVC